MKMNQVRKDKRKMNKNHAVIKGEEREKEPLVALLISIDLIHSNFTSTVSCISAERSWHKIEDNASFQTHN